MPTRLMRADESHNGINPQVGTSYTLAIDDANGIVEMDNAGENTLIVPLDSSVAFSNRSSILVVQTGAGRTTIQGAVGVTVHSAGGAYDVPGQLRSVLLYKRGTNEWVLFGGGMSAIQGYVTTIPFKLPYTYIGQHTIVGSATFTPSLTDAVPGAVTTLRLVTDGDITHIQDFTAFKKVDGSTDLDNSVAGYLYLIQFFFDGQGSNGFWVNIWKEADALPMDTTAPTITGASIEDAHPDSIDIVFDETVSTTLPAASTIHATGSVTGAQTASALTRPLADTVRAQFPADWVAGETVTFDYTQGGTSSDIADLSGNKLANVTGHAVTNNLSSDLMQFVPANWTTAAGGYVGHSNTPGQDTAYSNQPIADGEYFICRDAPGNSGAVEGWFGISDTPIDAQGYEYVAHPLLLGTDFNVYKNGATNLGAYTRGDYFKFTNESGEYKIYKSSDGVSYSLIGSFGTLSGDWYFGLNLGNNEAVESLSRG